MNLLFTFSDNTQIESPFLLDGAKISENFYKELRIADNSASLKVPFNEILCDKLKAEINKNIKVQIVNNNENVFSGYVRKTLSFLKTQRNQPFSLEIVSPSLLLNVDYNGTVVHYVNKTVAEIVSILLSFTDFSGSINTYALGDIATVSFTLSNGENIANVLEELLYEYGYIYQFDKDGNFYVENIFTVPSPGITQHFNGDNCLNEIQQNVKEDSFKQVVVTWTKVAQRNNVVIFEDTTGADTNHIANIEIPSASFYLGEAHNYCNYDSKFQKVIWITETSLDIEYLDSSTISQTFENLGDKGDLSIYNSGNGSNFIHKLQIKGNGLFELATMQNKTGSSGAAKEVSAKYIQNDLYAGILAKKLLDYYNYANFTISVKSKTKYEIGTFCDVSDYGIGTINARIISRVWNIKDNSYNYTLESISEYTPVETYISNQFVNSNKDDGETIRDTLNDLNTKVDNIKTDTTMCTADNLSAFLTTDESNKTVTETTIETTITLRQSDIDLPFSIGSMSLPEGWNYRIVGKKIIFTVGSGVTIKSGKFAIPVQYRVPVSQNEYVDENGNPYVDEAGNKYIEQIMSQSYTQWTLYFQYYASNGGIYLGLITSVSSIPSANYGDYFTWGGGNNTPSPLSIDGKFMQGVVYKFVGNKQAYQWVRDEDIGHNQKASSDIYGIANADLKSNNSIAWEYLDHLTANTIYVDLLVANSAFIDRLQTNLVSAGMITTGQLSESSANAKIQAEQDAINKLGLSTDVVSGSVVITGGTILADYINVGTLKVENAKYADNAGNTGTVQGYTLIEGDKIKTGLLNVNEIWANIFTAKSGTFENLTVTGNFLSTKGIQCNIERVITSFSSLFNLGLAIHRTPTNWGYGTPTFCAGFIVLSGIENTTYRIMPTVISELYSPAIGWATKIQGFIEPSNDDNFCGFVTFSQGVEPAIQINGINGNTFNYYSSDFNFSGTIYC